MVLVRLFCDFFKIGLFTFGGGYAMIPLIEKEVVEKNHWLTTEQFVDLVVIAETTPGPFAVNSATFVGYRVAKIWGAVFGTLGVILPSFLIVGAIAAWGYSFRKNPIVGAAFQGLRPAVLALIVVAVYSVAKVALVDAGSVLILILVTVAVVFLKVHPIAVLVLSGLIGMVFFK